MSLTTLLVPGYTQMLQAMSAFLEKARAQVEPAKAEALLSARLAPDMYPLSTQIRFACFQAWDAVYRLRGEPVPDAVLQLAQEGQNAGERPGTLADAHARIDETLAFLGGLSPDALDAGVKQPVSIELPNGMIFDLSGENYVRDWALPQFHFHVVTAYAILRGEGIDLGKADYVPHMFAYLRPGTVPDA